MWCIVEKIKKRLDLKNAEMDNLNNKMRKRDN